MMWKDPIVEDVHRIREEHARRFKGDLKAIFEDLKHREEQAKRNGRRFEDRSRRENEAIGKNAAIEQIPAAADDSPPHSR